MTKYPTLTIKSSECMNRKILVHHIVQHHKNQGILDEFPDEPLLQFFLFFFIISSYNDVIYIHPKNSNSLCRVFHEETVIYNQTVRSVRKQFFLSIENNQKQGIPVLEGF